MAKYAQRLLLVEFVKLALIKNILSPAVWFVVCSFNNVGVSDNVKYRHGFYYSLKHVGWS